jgi:hypothetical protein
MIFKLGPSLRIKLVERLLGIGKLLHCGIL